MDATICPSCHYPHLEPACPNPRCFANPAVSEETKAEWRAADEQRRADEAERERFARIRARSFEPRR